MPDCDGFSSQRGPHCHAAAATQSDRAAAGRFREPVGLRGSSQSGACSTVRSAPDRKTSQADARCARDLHERPLRPLAPELSRALGPLRPRPGHGRHDRTAAQTSTPEGADADEGSIEGRRLAVVPSVGGFSLIATRLESMPMLVAAIDIDSYQARAAWRSFSSRAGGALHRARHSWANHASAAKCGSTPAAAKCACRACCAIRSSAGSKPAPSTVMTRASIWTKNLSAARSWLQAGRCLAQALGRRRRGTCVYIHLPSASMASEARNV